MRAPAADLIAMENRFWQSIVDRDAETAVTLLCEPALMVSGHGAIKFDHAAYRRMVEQGTMGLDSFEFSDIDVVFPSDVTAILTYRVRQKMSPRGGSGGGAVTQEMADSSTWVSRDGTWRCAMHTETPLEPKKGR